jgi:hypothetical protein
VKEKIAYEIKYGPDFPPFLVKNSANAWWLERHKIENLINAFKYDYPVKSACTLANITERQYKYFIELHPEFRDVKEYCESMLVIRAQKTLIDNLWRPEIALKWLEKKKPEDWGKRKSMIIQIPYCLGCKKEIPPNMVPNESKPKKVEKEDISKEIKINSEQEKPKEKSPEQIYLEKWEAYKKRHDIT